MFLLIATDYLFWHYHHGFRRLFHIAKNFLWFIVYYFSLTHTLTTLVAPWRRISVERGDRFSIEDFAGYYIVNLVSRLIGAVIRLGLMTLGLAALILYIVSVLITILFWLVAPIAVTMFFLGSLWLLIATYL